ncbi:MAG: homoserine kinase, partial [Deltaproteobacteria bacterium]|nr:homoserine kinase [Deltaproteobacteria bacterium]
MANYSTIEKKELETLLCSYDVGRIIEYHGLKGGLANSSFKINSDQGSYILTI